MSNYASHIYCGAEQVCCKDTRSNNTENFYLNTADPRIVLRLCIPKLRKVVRRELAQKVGISVFRRGIQIAINIDDFLLSPLGFLVGFSLVLRLTATHADL